MVQYKDGNIYLKIVYYGMAGCGKTTILETLYKLTKDGKQEIIPVSDIQKIDRTSGATLYFDRGIFQSTKKKKIYYRVYTVAGQRSFTALRRKVIDQLDAETDAVIFVVDSQIKYFEDNIEFLTELKNITNNRLIKEIPFIVMLNKQDLKDVIDEDDFIHILKREKLWYEPDHELYIWSPLIYKTCALYEKHKDIYRSFHEIARRTGLYHIYGDGSAPNDKKFTDTSILTR
ncbi:MAG: ADP-ribosylation factor-like protein [Candidatus Lokiarchaeia archaeon]|nr:ADP-ribosylation factor-like protein [Candidatus Lokiarchaeia archaeon]